MRATSILLTALTIFACNAPAFALAPDEPAAPSISTEPNANLTPEKKALIMDLLKITEADKTVDKVVAQMMAAHQRQYPVMIAQIINSNTNLTAEQKKDLIEKSQARSQQSSERLKELFKEKIDLGALLNKVALVVYDKNFTDGELKDIIAFYKTPTGQKTLKQMPEVMRESMDMTSTLIAPQMSQIITQLMDEEKAKLKSVDKPEEPATTK
ncbi:MAG: DUF2059 domain-containing protein [Cyanobacteria bacterium SZAS-4]|nr:DUF2059 domain-containing protein [Cyanobacteria bacterium SZAS-4]